MAAIVVIFGRMICTVSFKPERQGGILMLVGRLCHNG